MFIGGSFAIKSPRRAQKRPIQTFISNEKEDLENFHFSSSKNFKEQTFCSPKQNKCDLAFEDNHDFSRTVLPFASINPERKKYNEYLESRKLQQNKMAKDLKLQIQQQRKALEKSYGSFSPSSIQQQAELLIQQLRSSDVVSESNKQKSEFPQFNATNLPDYQKTVEKSSLLHPHNKIGQIKSMREYLYGDRPRASVPLRENSIPVRPVKHNMLKFPKKSLSIINPSDYGARLDTASELVYPDGHISSLTTPEGPR